MVPKMNFGNRVLAAVAEKSVTAGDWLAARRGRVAEKPEHLVTGERGELAALFYLMRNGYEVVARRWNEGPEPGDLDLVAWQEEVLCFIEVKTRTAEGLAAPELAVDAHKRKILRRLAEQYLRHLPGEERTPRVRFDIVTVVELPGQARRIRLIPGAFGWSERRGRDD
jgi:putative endonuclease